MSWPRSSRRSGIRAEVIAADLGDPGERDRVQDEIEGHGLAVEVLVNNAGFGGGPNFANTERERLLEMTRLNVEAVVDLTARFVPAMVARGQGTVINTASTAAFQPLPGTANYAATKAFVLSLSEAISSELGSKGITVTALCPGPVRTEFMEAANLEHTEETTPGLSLVDRRRGRRRRRPRCRAGEAGRGARDLEPRRRPHGPALAAVDRAAAGQADLELRDTRLT